MDIWSRLKRTEKPVLLYGMGDGADKIINVLEARGIKVSGVFASDGFVRNKVFHGFKLMSYSEAEARFGDFVVLLAFGSSLPSVIENIKSISKRQELLVPDVPVTGENLFDFEFVQNNFSKIKRVYELLETDFDKYIFESLIRYKLSGKPEYLYRSEVKKERVYEALDLNDGKILIDCGAFTGDSAKEILSYSPACKTLYAVEPDTKSYEKLVRCSMPDKRIIPINAAVSNGAGTLAFDVCGNRGSRRHGNKSSSVCTEVQTISIDMLLEGEKADFIKFDVEGMEAQAIEGAAETIKRFKPKMLVSCYHRSEDIFELPLKIFDIRSDYKLHIFHPPYLPAWDSAFYIV